MTETTESSTKSQNSIRDIDYHCECLIDGKKFILGVYRDTGKWNIYLTDFHKHWQEALEKNDILYRCKELNPAFNFEFNFDIDGLIEELLTNILKYKTSITTEKIILEKDFEGGLFRFTINLQKSSSADVFDHKYFEATFFSFSELKRRYLMLLDMVKKKDREIQDYKSQGNVVIHKTWETQPFDENVFELEEPSSHILDGITSFLELADFYKNIKPLHDTLKSSSHETLKSSHAIETISNHKQTNALIQSRKRKSSAMRCAIPARFDIKKKIMKQCLPDT